MAGIVLVVHVQEMVTLYVVMVHVMVVRHMKLVQRIVMHQVNVELVK